MDMDRPSPPFRRSLLGLAALVLFGGLFRFALVYSFHAPAGDGLQYYALSQELAVRHRFAFGPLLPETYSRLPGYPLFLAYVAVRQPGIGLVQHIVRATQANVLCDLGSAVLVFLMLQRVFGKRGGPGLRAAPLLGAGFVLASPLMFRLSCYALTESLATFLATLALYLALVAGQAARCAVRLGLSLLLGAVLGAGQLVRADALSLWPALLVLLLGLLARRRLAIGMLAVAGIGCLAVFAPWPLRNLQRFGHPHPFAWQWRTIDGTPLPTGPLEWARTWTTGSVGESYVDLAFALSLPLDPRRPGLVLPVMYDSDAERVRLISLYDRYNQERLSPAVNAAFFELAAERRARRPLRSYLVLPLRRLLAMWQPVAEHELPLRVRWLGLPSWRPLFTAWEYALYALAALGLWQLFRQRPGSGWRLGTALGLYVATRSLLLCYTVPLALTQRLLGPVMPALLGLAACGAAALGDALLSGRPKRGFHGNPGP